MQRCVERANQIQDVLQADSPVTVVPSLKNSPATTILQAHTLHFQQDLTMPSFDVVSEVNHHELSNAVDQANREVSTRFDFKGTGSNFQLKDQIITMNTESEFQLQQMYDMLCGKLVKRGIDIACLEKGEPVIQLKTATQAITVREGIETADSRKMVKLIKDRKIKVQSAIQGDQLRVTGKKRDDLQAVIALLKEGNFGLPLQFKNFRD